MAIALDNFNSGASWASTDPQTWTHTCTGSDLALFVYIFAGGNTDIITDVTYNGVSMTRVQRLSNDANPGSGNQHYLYVLFNPTTGSNTVSVDKTSAVNTTASSVSYTGVDTSTGIVDSRQDAGSNSTTSYTTGTFTPSTVDDWVVAFIRDVDGFVSSNDRLTFLGATGSPVPVETWDSNGTVGVTGAITHTYTLSPSGRIHGVLTAVITPAGGGGATFIPKILSS